jgi:hypothetical protein
LTSPEFVKEVLDVRIPTFSRQTQPADAAEAERPAANGPATTPVRPRRDSDTTTGTDVPPTVTPPPANPPTVPRRSESERAAAVDDTADLRPPSARTRPVDRRDTTDRLDTTDRRDVTDRLDTTDRRDVTDRPETTDRRDSADLRPPAAEPAVAAGPKPRSSMLATLGLILGVGAALLVLSGPLLGYGIGVAVVGLILSLSGIHATGKRHVAGKTDALIGMVLSLAAIVVGVLALTGSLSWLGTDMHPVDSFRQWLDAQFVNRF